MAQLRAHNPQGEELDPGQSMTGNDIMSGGPPDQFVNAPGGSNFEEAIGRNNPYANGISGTPDLNHGEARSGESGRERGDIQSTLRQVGGGGGSALGGPESPAAASPARPRSPQPMAGSVSPGGPMGDSTEGLLPFSPMGSPDVGSMASARGPSLYGGPGGLKGGGLGVPLDPRSNQMSDPISMLLKLIGGGQ